MNIGKGKGRRTWRNGPREEALKILENYKPIPLPEGAAREIRAVI